jgi:hypothetical protein
MIYSQEQQGRHNFCVTTLLAGLFDENSLRCDSAELAGLEVAYLTVLQTGLWVGHRN